VGPIGTLQDRLRIGSSVPVDGLVIGGNREAMAVWVLQENRQLIQAYLQSHWVVGAQTPFLSRNSLPSPFFPHSVSVTRVLIASYTQPHAVKSPPHSSGRVVAGQNLPLPHLQPHRISLPPTRNNLVFRHGTVPHKLAPPLWPA
jgi:hypothetical protein